MFTGLIQNTGKVVQLKAGAEVSTLTVNAKADFERCNIGESIAVNGACLTLTAVEGNNLSFEVMPQTLKLTTLENLKSGDNVNLERALKLDSLVDGHLVTGHVDARGEITQVIEKAKQRGLRIGIGRDLIKYVALRGSIAVDGASLTVAELQGRYFVVYLVPTTSQKTNLGERKVGDRVNVECDIIAKYAQRLLGNLAEAKSKITDKFLNEQGFK